VKTNPFEGGSDHTPFLRANKPGLLFWHFTDQFYHTDRDRLEMVSANEMKNVGVTALVSALALATADKAMVLGLVDEVKRAAIARLEAEGRLSADAVRGGAAAAEQRDIVETWAAWYRDALATFEDMELSGASAEVRAAIARAQDDVRAAGRSALARAGLGAGGA
jgi:hypothetical protein